MSGVKDDKEKLRYDLLDEEFIKGIVEVLTFGVQKYSPDNWKYVEDRKNRYWSALRRHLAAWRMGERNDSETGKSHLYHAACCLFFLDWEDRQEEEIVTSKQCMRASSYEGNDEEHEDYGEMTVGDLLEMLIGRTEENK